MPLKRPKNYGESWTRIPNRVNRPMPVLLLSRRADTSVSIALKKRTPISKETGVLDFLSNCNHIISDQ